MVNVNVNEEHTKSTNHFLITMITEKVMLVLWCSSSFVTVFLFVSIRSQNKVRLVKALVLLCHCLLQVFVFYFVIVFV